MDKREAPVTVDRQGFLNSRVRLPSHVVHRSFVTETVVLNLETGQYHGLNPMGGQMLETLSEASSIQDAAALIARQYEQDQARVEADMMAFCSDLLDRGLLEVVQDAAV